MRWGWFFLLLVMVLQYRIWFDDAGLVATWQMQQQVKAMQQDNRSLGERNENLRHDVINLQNANDVIAEKAREDLGLIEQDESFYLFVDEDK